MIAWETYYVSWYDSMWGDSVVNPRADSELQLPVHEVNPYDTLRTSKWDIWITGTW
jgi:hypothetical protein